MKIKIINLLIAIKEENGKSNRILNIFGREPKNMFNSEEHNN